MLTSVDTTAASTTSAIAGTLELDIVDLDPDVTALIADVDAILCAALTPARARRPPVPRVTGSDRPRLDRLGGPSVRPSAPRHAPGQHVQAVQRSPPV